MNIFRIQLLYLQPMSQSTLSIILTTLLGTAPFWWYIPYGSRVAANETTLDETLPKDVRELQDQAVRVDDPNAFYDVKATLKLADGGTLEFHYDSISDSGVHLQRLNHQGETIWKQDCVGLGVLHSEYYHKAFVYIESNTVRVISIGSRGTFVERLDLSSGKRISRSISCDSYGNPPRCIPAYPVNSSRTH